jgi:hypothetical protein
MARRPPPLVARVAANRAWAAFFGTGLVRTTSNFGYRGESPSHPALLDALAEYLVRSKWSMKALHRTLVLSRTYRQATAVMRPDADPELRSCRRSPDDVSKPSSCATDSSRPPAASTAPWAVAPRRRRGRLRDERPVAGQRSLRHASPNAHLPAIRNALFDYLGTFDFGDPSMSQETRTTTIVPAQALWLMNSPFMADRAAAAAKWAAETPNTGRLDMLWERIVGRLPTDAERRISETYLQGGDWARYVRVLLASDAVVFLD